VFDFGGHNWFWLVNELKMAEHLGTQWPEKDAPGKLCLKGSETSIGKYSSAHQAYISAARSFSDFKMGFKPKDSTLLVFANLLGQLQVGRQPWDKFLQNTGGLGTAINNANAGECQLIY
jgi:hypothetical protein